LGKLGPAEEFISLSKWIVLQAKPLPSPPSSSPNGDEVRFQNDERKKERKEDSHSSH